MKMLKSCDRNSFVTNRIAPFCLVCLSYIIIVDHGLPRIIYQPEHRTKFNKTEVHLTTHTPRNLKAIHYETVKTTIPSKADAKEQFVETRAQISRGSTEKRNIEEKKQPSAKAKIKIVVYFPLQIRISNQIYQLKMNKCENKNCLVQQIFVEINGSIIDADAVVFQGNNMPKFLPTRRDTEQVFIFLNNEPPLYMQLTNLNNSAFWNYFNWTMTYRIDSDIPLLYGEIVHKQTSLEEKVNARMQGMLSNKSYYSHTAFEKNYSVIFEQKSKNAFWIVSHCFTKSKRESYIHRMKNYTEIDQFGLCNKKQVTQESYALDKMSKQYKFYLAFENTFCNDYITEKVFSWFASDLVLVVRGGCDYSKFLPKGTYIDAKKFGTPVKLAHFLTSLGRNKREYIRILKKKDEYRVIKELDMVQSAFCNLCNRLNNVNKYRKSVANIYGWWQEKSCWKPKDLRR